MLVVDMHCLGCVYSPMSCYTHTGTLRLNMGTRCAQHASNLHCELFEKF